MSYMHKVQVLPAREEEIKFARKLASLYQKSTLGTVYSEPAAHVEYRILTLLRGISTYTTSAMSSTEWVDIVDKLSKSRKLTVSRLQSPELAESYTYIGKAMRGYLVERFDGTHYIFDIMENIAVRSLVYNLLIAFKTIRDTLYK